MCGDGVVLLSAQRANLLLYTQLSCITTGPSSLHLVHLFIHFPFFFFMWAGKWEVENESGRNLGMGKDKQTHHSENGGIHWIRVCVFLCICLVQFARVLTSNLIRCDLFIYYVLWRAMMLTGDCKTVRSCPGPISDLGLVLFIECF